MPEAGRILTSIFMALSVLAGCGSGHDPVDLPVGGALLPPLEPGRWYLHEVDGRPIPGVVREPPPGAGLERTQVDSACFDVLPGASIEYRAWMVRTRADGSMQNVAQLGTGTWSATSEVYILRIGSGSRTITLSPTSEGALEGDEGLPVDVGGATIHVVYRSEPPPGG